MQTWTSRLAVAATAAALALGAAACGGSPTPDRAAPSAVGAPSAAGAPCAGAPAAGAPAGGAPGAGTTAGASVVLAGSPLGQVLTDRAGRVLYAFVNDKGSRSTCVDECIATWPALAGVTPATAGPGVDRTLLGSVPRSEGTVQATYGGWPLYYYAGDALPGDVTGQGVDGEWFAVGRDGKLVKAGA